MLYGRSPRYLNIDLTNERYETKEISSEILREYPSGIALATRLLQSFLATGTPPLSPQNVVVLAPGIFAGTPFPGGTRVAMVSKSPLTNLWMGGTVGGSLAWVLRQTEWDAVVIQGRASRLSYLLLDQGRVFFRSARELEGRGCGRTEELLRESWGSQASVLCIGPAGESQVRFAVVDSGSLEGYLPGGMGAVLGAKNLKAVVVRPHEPIQPKETQQFLDAVLPLIKGSSLSSSVPSPSTTTPEDLLKLDELGALPTRNFQTASVSPSWLQSLGLLETRRRSCPGCPAACLRVLPPAKGPHSSEAIGEIPLVTEQVWALGPLLDLSEVDPTLSAIAACREFGLDPVSLGVVASWMGECREKHVEPGFAWDPEAGFGSASWIVGLAQRVAGDPEVREFLGRGVLCASEKVGGGATDFAMHFWGQELVLSDPRRGYWPLSFLGPAVRIPPRGNGVFSEAASQPDPVEERILAEDHWAFLETLGVCGRVAFPPDELRHRLPSLLGLMLSEPIDYDQAFSWGQKCVKLIEGLNWREGWRWRGLDLPQRFFRESLVTPGKVYVALDPEEWLRTREGYLLRRGWARD